MQTNIVFTNFLFFILGMLVIFTLLLFKPVTQAILFSAASIISPIPKSQMIEPNQNPIGYEETVVLGK